MTLHDLSHPIENGMITYKGLPPPLVNAKAFGTFPVRASAEVKEGRQ